MACEIVAWTGRRNDSTSGEEGWIRGPPTRMKAIERESVRSEKTYLEVLSRTYGFDDLALMACVHRSPERTRKEGRHCAYWPVRWDELDDGAQRQ